MSATSRARPGKREAKAREAISRAQDEVRASMLGEVLGAVRVELCERPEGAPLVGSVSAEGRLVVLNPHTPLELGPREWAFALGHLLAHLGLSHAARAGGRDPALWALACELSADVFVAHARVGAPLASMPVDMAWAGRREEDIYDALSRDRRQALEGLRTLAGPGRLDMSQGPPPRASRRGPPCGPAQAKAESFERLLARGISRSVSDAVERAAERLGQAQEAGWPPAERARRWVMSCLPLFGALAAEVRVVAERDACHRRGIAIAAVDAAEAVVYLNPASGLGDEEVRYAFVHELLHLALMHAPRRRGRDPFLWNAACCAVADAYLAEMAVGQPPGVVAAGGGARFGLGREAASQMSVEQLYDVLAAEPRRAKGARGLRGDRGDMLERREGCGGQCDGWAIDDFIKRCLASGLACPSRGFVPAGLVEEIEVLFTPPVPWDVELARWMDRHVPVVRESVRSYARASRRQASTPDIPRPARHVPREWLEASTFGVVLDTSGSMDDELLGRALGAIASFAEARSVPAVRLVSCDAAPFDHGFVAPSELRGTFAVKGRGGTVLQQGIAALLACRDLPREAPVMILTDGLCESELYVPREHCFLLPRPERSEGGSVWGRVTLRTTAPVFRVLRQAAV